MIRFKVRSQPVRFSVKGTGALKMKVSPAKKVYLGSERFAGPYEVTPKVDAQTLHTKDKTMAEDLTVLAVPYYEMDNQTGTTIFIASEV